jgi:hypothetical protein
LNRAQSALEYCLIFAVLLAALLSMSVYIRRSLQGNVRQSADQLGERYSPQHTRSDIIHRMYTGEIDRTTIGEESANIDGENKTVITINSDFDREDITNTLGWERIE